mgnify:CR=1 FL=1
MLFRLFEMKIKNVSFKVCFNFLLLFLERDFVKEDNLSKSNFLKIKLYPQIFTIQSLHFLSDTLNHRKATPFSFVADVISMDSLALSSVRLFISLPFDCRDFSCSRCKDNISFWKKNIKTFQTFALFNCIREAAKSVFSGHPYFWFISKYLKFSSFGGIINNYCFWQDLTLVQRRGGWIYSLFFTIMFTTKKDFSEGSVNYEIWLYFTMQKKNHEILLFFLNLN